MGNKMLILVSCGENGLSNDQANVVAKCLEEQNKHPDMAISSLGSNANIIRQSVANLAFHLNEGVHFFRETEPRKRVMNSFERENPDSLEDIDTSGWGGQVEERGKYTKACISQIMQEIRSSETYGAPDNDMGTVLVVGEDIVIEDLSNQLAYTNSPAEPGETFGASISVHNCSAPNFSEVEFGNNDVITVVDVDGLIEDGYLANDLSDNTCG